MPGETSFTRNPHIGEEIHHYYRQDTAPANADGQLQVGDIWSDTTANLVKRCTSLSPITFVSTEGGSAAHSILSTTHDDVFDTDTPVDQDVLTWVAANSRWESVAAAGATHALGAPSTLTIASGTVTVTGRYHLIDTEAAAASDNLAGMAGGSDGDIVAIRPANDARTVVVTHEDTEATTATERFNLPGDASITLDDVDDMLPVVYDSTIGRWIVLETFGKRHGDLTGTGTDDHHARDHAASHASGGADDLTAQTVEVDQLYVNETANANQTNGLTINQGAADDELIAGKSSDVAHGVTNETETDTFLVIEKVSGVNGGARIRGFRDATRPGLRLDGISTTASTTKVQSGQGQIDLDAAITSGINIAAVGADGNLVAIRNNGNSRFIFDAEGTLHLIPGSDTDFDALVAQVTGTPTLAWDETNNRWNITPRLAIDGIDATEQLKSLVVEDPTSSENITFFFTDRAITIAQVNDVVQGTTPSLTWNIRHATTRNSGSPNDLFSANRTTTSESGAETTTFADATIPAGSWVWLISSAESGTTDEFAVTIHYTVD